jgi:hypothetical protein
MHEVHRPTLVAPCRWFNRDCRPAQTLATHAWHKQMLFPADPVNLLVVYTSAFPAQHRRDPQMPESLALTSNLANTLPQFAVISDLSFVIHYRPADPHQSTSSSLADLMLFSCPPHRFSPCSRH